VEGGRQFGRDAANPVILQVTALPGYLEAMGVTLRAGRTFQERDSQAGAPKVVLVNEAFVKHFWETTDVVGKRIHYPGGNDWFQVVGVVHDIRHYGLDGVQRPQVFASFAMTPVNGMTIAIRGAGDPHRFTASAHETIRALDPDLPMFNIRTMEERLDRSLWTRRAYSWLFAAFASVAVLLAAAGVYGVISFAVSQRTREIGIRMALGARPAQVMIAVIRQGMVLVSIGLVLGLAASQLSSRLLESMLFGVTPRDLPTYLAVGAGVVLVGLAANYLPARRAASIEPVRALRTD